MREIKSIPRRPSIAMENLLDWKHQPFILSIKKNKLVLRGHFSSKGVCVCGGGGRVCAERG